MELQEKVLNYFKTYTKPIEIKRLAKKLGIDMSLIDDLSDVLYDLENKGIIMAITEGEYMKVPTDFYLTFGEVHHSIRDNYYLKLRNGVKVILDNKGNCLNLNEGDKVFVETRPSGKHKKQLLGTVQRIVRKEYSENGKFMFKAILKKSRSNNYFYVEFKGKRFFIPTDKVHGAYIGDEVSVMGSILDDNYAAEVKGIIKRKTNKHVFKVRTIDGKKMLSPIGTAYYEVKPLFDVDAYEEGEDLLLEVDDEYRATYVKTLKVENDLDSRIRALAYDNGIPVDFSDEVMEEAKNMRSDITEEEISKRTDLRDLLTVTIDSETAKDLDDAVSIEKLSDRFRLYVSIADVSHYVYPGSKLFISALERGTSIYPANSVIPMLPPKLSNGICSLNEGEDKLTKSCIIDIGFDGNIIDYNVVNSIIRSNKKMSYHDVNRVLDGEEVPGYMEYADMIRHLKELSDILEDRRIDRGFIHFVNDEVKFVYDENNNVCGIKSRERGDAEKIIENCMLVANECVAELAFNLEVPFVYRNHESPSVSKIYQLKYKIKGFHKYLTSLANAQNPKILQKIFLSLCEGKSDYEKEFVSKMILRSMNRAFYSSENMGHYGLALDVYATFTSPIRRLPDLLNHIMLNYIIEGKFDSLDHFIDCYASWARDATSKQLESEEFEENVNIMLIQKYTDQFMDKVLTGRIVFAYNNHVYIETKEGLYGYIILGANNVRRGEFKIGGRRYHIGGTIEVKILKCDEIDHEIIFVPSDSKELNEGNNHKKVLERRGNNG